MRLSLSAFRRHLEVTYGPSGSADDAATDAGPGASAVLDQQSACGFAPPDYWTDDPDEPECPDEW